MTRQPTAEGEFSFGLWTIGSTEMDTPCTAARSGPPNATAASYVGDSAHSDICPAEGIR
jgi:hypothetical protein